MPVKVITANIKDYPIHFHDEIEVAFVLEGSVKLRVGDGKAFKVTAKGISDKNMLVKSAALNGRPLCEMKIRHADIMRGGELAFEMK